MLQKDEERLTEKSSVPEAHRGLPLGSTAHLTAEHVPSARAVGAQSHLAGPWQGSACLVIAGLGGTVLATSSPSFLHPSPAVA